MAGYTTYFMQDYVYRVGVPPSMQPSGRAWWLCYGDMYRSMCAVISMICRSHPSETWAPTTSAWQAVQRAAPAAGPRRRSRWRRRRRA